VLPRRPNLCGGDIRSSVIRASRRRNLHPDSSSLPSQKRRVHSRRIHGRKCRSYIWIICQLPPGTDVAPHFGAPKLVLRLYKLGSYTGCEKQTEKRQCPERTV
jgi:hypothetical protein